MSFKKPPAFSKSDLQRGFEALAQLWNRNFIPEDLERHYFLYWFVVCDGNIIKAARALQIHRNTIQWHFVNFGFGNKALVLRRFWKRLIAENKKASFESNFLKFQRQFNGEKKFTREENKILTSLWKTRFPFKTLAAHYLLWTLRAEKPKDWVLAKLDYSNRHRLRRLTSILDSGTRDGFWLESLKPNSKEIYSLRYRKILSKSKK